MQVKQILDKICEQNEAIHGALVRSHDKVHHNFSGVYEMIDIESITDLAEQALMLTRSLEADDNEFNAVFFEYDQHSLFVRQIDAGLFILLTAPMERAVYKKTKVGINLFIKKLCKALESNEEPETLSGQAQAEAPKLNGHARPEPIIASRNDNDSAAQEAESEPEAPPKKKRFYRGQWY